MAIEFIVSTVIKAFPEEIYEAWLSSDRHAKMTGGSANITAELGAEFEAWDGYIQGRNLALEPHKRIVQSWRTADFSDDEQDSQIEVLFEKKGDGTEVIIRHTNLPPHGRQYEQGWIENYFEPMKEYFER
jgi:activator of HSP90 ATPase